MLLFGPKLNQVFASRWKALFWACGVMATAYCTIPSAEETADSASEQAAASAASASGNPWAKGN